MQKLFGSAFLCIVFNMSAQEVVWQKDRFGKAEEVSYFNKHINGKDKRNYYYNNFKF